jgi:predicted nucleic acid-binding protein
MHTNQKEKQYVVDASVAVKLFCLEEGSSMARAMLEKGQMGKIRLFAPDLLLYEVGNALGRGKRLGGKEIAEALDLLLRSSIEFLELTERIIEHASSFMERYKLTFYDASYAAFAYEWGIPLISANLKDHSKITEVKIQNLYKVRI